MSFKPFGTVRGGLHRADVFAGRVFALHAGNGLLDHFGIVLIARVVAIHADPVHFAAAQHLIFADHRSVVFRHAGDHAGVAAGAGRQVDRHAPLVALVVGELGIDGVDFGNFRHLLDELGVLLVFLDGDFAGQRTAVLVVAGAALLRGRQRLALAGRRERKARREVEAVAGADQIGVEADVFADAPALLRARSRARSKPHRRRGPAGPSPRLPS